MKIVIIPGWFKTKSFPYSGIFFLDQARSLRSLGHEVVIIVPGVLGIKDILKNDSWRFTKTMEDGIPIFYLRIAFPYLYKFPRLFQMAWFFTSKFLYDKAIEEFGKPDVIHAHHCITAGMQAIALRSKDNPQCIVVTEHSSMFLEKSISKDAKKKLNHIMSNVDEFICVSDGLKRNIECIVGEDSSKIKVVPNMVKSLFFDLPIAPRNAESRVYTFISCGNMVEIKGFEFLIRSFAKALELGMRSRLLLIGDGYLRRTLEKLAKKLKIEGNIEFLGNKKPIEVAEYLAKCDCFCSTSHKETFGIAMCEAMASGLPILATDTEGANYIINRDYIGHIIKDRDINEFAKWMLMFSNGKFESNPVILREEAYERFGEKTIAIRLTKIYENCINEKLKSRKLASRIYG